MGRHSAMEILSESSDILAASFLSPITIFAAIAGTTEMVKGVINAAGTLNRVCALP